MTRTLVFVILGLLAIIWLMLSFWDPNVILAIVNFISTVARGVKNLPAISTH